MNDFYTQEVNKTKAYYNSCDADNFYAHIWGGDDIHIGMYENDADTIKQASHRTIRKMANLSDINRSSKVLDIGSGYCGAARYLATTFNCKITALNLSEKENQRARQLNKQNSLSDQITVMDGSFECMPLKNKSFDCVWCQDAILHSANKQKVFEEVARVLKPGGCFVFCDPMQTDHCPKGVLQPILDRIHLSALASPAFYRNIAYQTGFKDMLYYDYSVQLTRHYQSVLNETNRREKELKKHVNITYLNQMKKGLSHWIDGGLKGHLCWGIFKLNKKQTGNVDIN
ncbi:methyltransferase domain-containing protein [Zooshikella ganghwensis]|uniref:Methyltransferase domain-containing protein n=1 Tax=Zooshikella ganghwensis TaxID=202772 RepID=A0A4P9VQ68_9GAMM|nr:methyltransferase domain-containing protein [Zooshikella ganghwensis]RDH44222.1 methyltransferase domain-containing protein [Zooshikella ganghwensis]